MTFVVVGAGARGATYGRLLLDHPADAAVVAIASPQHPLRTALQHECGLPDEAVVDSWQQLVAGPRVADAAVLAVQDRDHHPAALALIDAGYDLLLEKPIAPTEAECAQIVDRARQRGTRLALCFVLRHTPANDVLQQVLGDGLIGDIVAIDHLEPVGVLHFAHSFVRGPWRNVSGSGSVLLTKSCHDIDYLLSLVPDPPTRVASFGSLTQFGPAHAPAGATDRCTTCPAEADCAFSAPRFYRRGLHEDGYERYFTRAIAPNLTAAEVDHELEHGPYGRCVFGVDNDVADHQVVQLEFAGGQTASFTLVAQTRVAHRQTRIFGTRGQLTGDGTGWDRHDHLTQQVTRHEADGGGATSGEGHGGGDAGLVAAVVRSWVHDSDELASAESSLLAHRVVFAAERARRSGRVVSIEV